MTYTAAALLGVLVSIGIDLLVLRTRLLTRRLFWLSYAIIFCFQLVTNGVLTGRRVVTYDGAAILGSARPELLGHGRVAYAPVEDLLFGFALVLQTLAWWVWWGRVARLRGLRRRSGSRP